jgi:hypothetical protein
MEADHLPVNALGNIFGSSAKLLKLEELVDALG